MIMKRPDLKREDDMQNPEQSPMNPESEINNGEEELDYPMDIMEMLENMQMPQRGQSQQRQIHIEPKEDTMEE